MPAIQAIANIRSPEGALTALTAIVDDVKEQINTLVSKLGDLRNTISRQVAPITELVRAFRPFQVVQFNRALSDMQAVLGEILQDTFTDLIANVRSFADYLYNLPDSFKEVIKFVGELITHFGGLGILISKLNATIEGSKSLKEFQRLVESTFQALIDWAKRLWTDIEPQVLRITTKIVDILNEMRPQIEKFIDALSALEPVIRANLDTIEFFINLLKELQGLTPGGLLAKLNPAPPLPEVNRPPFAPAFGKAAWQDAGVKNPADVFRDIQDKILRAQGIADQRNREDAEAAKQDQRHIEVMHFESRQATTLDKILAAILGTNKPEDYEEMHFETVGR